MFNQNKIKTYLLFIIGKRLLFSVVGGGCTFNDNKEGSCCPVFVDELIRLPFVAAVARYR